MTTVTAKTLRNNLSEYLDRLEKGEEIAIIRHSKIIGSLKPTNDKVFPNGSAVSAMLKRNRDAFRMYTGLTSDEIPTKKLYHDATDKKYDA